MSICGVPRDVDALLRRKAVRWEKSLNPLIVDEQTLATVGRKKRADFSDLVGRGTPDPGFDEILAAIRQH